MTDSKTQKAKSSQKAKQSAGKKIKNKAKSASKSKSKKPKTLVDESLNEIDFGVEEENQKMVEEIPEDAAEELIDDDSDEQALESKQGKKRAKSVKNKSLKSSRKPDPSEKTNSPKQKSEFAAEVSKQKSQPLEILLQKTAGSEKSDTAVYFSQIKKKGKDSLVAINSAEVKKLLDNAIKNKVISGKAKEACLFRETNWGGYTNTLVVGIGSDPTHESFRQAGAATIKALVACKAKSADVFLDGAFVGKTDSTVGTQSFSEGILLANYKFDELKSKKADDNDTLKTIVLVHSKASDKACKSAFDAAKILAEAVNFSRRLGDLPGNLMTPTIMADTVLEHIKGTKIKATIWDKNKIEKERMGGLLGVAQGSIQDPRFIILEYKGAAVGKKPIVFVGKGLTFDTGGISIKPSAAMEEMKYDKCGGCNVIGALVAIANLGLKVNAIGLVPATENMPGSAATKPGDVHTARNGKTFEVNNTDAEGRLILADALCYASELEPELIVDAATLTGAMVISLGNIHSGFFTRSEQVTSRVQKAATASGEWVWRMPITDFHVEDMKGVFADLSNTGPSKAAGSATAAAFLEQFVGEGIPWVHFDIAGTGWAVGNRLNYCPTKGASGAMVRTFVEIARGFAK